MITVLIPPDAPAESITLDDDEAHHLRVRRLEAPASVRFTDGAGRSGTGLVTLRGRRLILDPTSATTVPRPTPRVLAVAAGDKDRFAWMVEKATELGATDIVPLDVERSRGVAGGIRPGHETRLERRAREALKQCGAAWAPRIHPPLSLPAFLLSGEGSFPVRWLMDAGGRPAGSVVVASPAVAVVGPEGGFTEAERGTLVGSGFSPVKGGPYTLRFETAALAALVLLQAGTTTST